MMTNADDACPIPGASNEAQAADAAARIRDLNDWVRRSFLGGKVVMTRGVSNLEPERIAVLLDRVRHFDVFTPDNDPHGEHDFGAFDEGGDRFFWKIDYYDIQMEFGSSNPADPAVTERRWTMRRGWWDSVARQVASFTGVVFWLHGPIVSGPGSKAAVQRRRHTARLYFDSCRGDAPQRAATCTRSGNARHLRGSNERHSAQKATYALSRFSKLSALRSTARKFRFGPGAVGLLSRRSPEEAAYQRTCVGKVRPPPPVVEWLTARSQERTFRAA
jgi:hypothetical protein